MGVIVKKQTKKTAHLWEGKMPSESGYLPPSLTLEPDYFTLLPSRRGEGGGGEQNKA